MYSHTAAYQSTQKRTSKSIREIKSRQITSIEIKSKRKKEKKHIFGCFARKNCLALFVALTESFYLILFCNDPIILTRVIGTLCMSVVASTAQHNSFCFCHSSSTHMWLISGRLDISRGSGRMQKALIIRAVGLNSKSIAQFVTSV